MSSEAYQAGLSWRLCPTSRMPECDYVPRTVEEAESYIRGLFEAVGEVFDPDPHVEGNLVVIFKNPPQILADLLKSFGIDCMETTDEKGAERFVVIYDQESVELFFKRIRPRLPEVEPLLRKVARYYDSEFNN
ncbi:MAG: hypothetical protein ABWJ97_05830 [Thermoproteus sp.]